MVERPAIAEHQSTETPQRHRDACVMPMLAGLSAAHRDSSIAANWSGSMLPLVTHFGDCVCEGSSLAGVAFAEYDASFDFDWLAVFTLTD